jgi:hypothetical protein
MKKATNTQPSSSNNLQHELGKELSVILACCFLLRENLRDALSAEELRQLYKIERSAEKIHSLVARLLGPAPAAQTKGLSGRQTKNKIAPRAL